MKNDLTFDGQTANFMIALNQEVNNSSTYIRLIIMAVFKDLLIRGSYYAELGVTDPEAWTEMMIDECGNEIKPHLDYVMLYSFMMAYKNAGSNSSLKRDLRRELKKMRKADLKHEGNDY